MDSEVIISTLYEQYETGIDEIDEQHKELVEIINGVYSVCISGHENSRINRFINYLNNFTETHFCTEEKYMTKYNYPGTEKHKNAHQEFKQMCKYIKNSFKAEKNPKRISEFINNNISNWLPKHIETEDLMLAEYLRQYIK